MIDRNVAPSSVDRRHRRPCLCALVARCRHRYRYVIDCSVDWSVIDYPVAPIRTSVPAPALCRRALPLQHPPVAPLLSSFQHRPPSAPVLLFQHWPPSAPLLPSQHWPVATASVLAIAIPPVPTGRRCHRPFPIPTVASVATASISALARCATALSFSALARCHCFRS